MLQKQEQKEDTTKAEKSKQSLRSKSLYKLEIQALKVIPMILAFITFLNATLSYLDVDVPCLSYIGGISILPLCFLYLSSYVFQFCLFHRLFLHYITVNWILNTVDFTIGLPVNDTKLFIIYSTITLIFIVCLIKV